MTQKVRLGVIGVGGMGGDHARQVLDGQIGRCELAAVCDADAGRLAGFAPELRFERADDLFASGRVDAVLIATPHFSHVPLGVAALAAGLHVLAEKPVAVHKADALRLLGAPLLAPAAEGLHSVELANAMILSSMRGKTVNPPMDASEYAPLLDELIAASPKKVRSF